MRISTHIILFICNDICPSFARWQIQIYGVPWNITFESKAYRDWKPDFLFSFQEMCHISSGEETNNKPQ